MKQENVPIDRDSLSKAAGVLFLDDNGDYTRFVIVSSLRKFAFSVFYDPSYQSTK